MTSLKIALCTLGFAGCQILGISDATNDETYDETADTGECTFTATCADLCADAQTTCAGTYTDAAACETACASYADGCDGDTSGNTVACRAYHLGAAAADAATHCPHVAEDGGGVCVD